MPASHCFRVIGQAFERFGENGKSAVNCQGLGFGVWSLGLGVWGLGFGFRYLGFGVWGLGFGV